MSFSTLYSVSVNCVNTVKTTRKALKYMTFRVDDDLTMIDDDRQNRQLIDAIDAIDGNDDDDELDDEHDRQGKYLWS